MFKVYQSGSAHMEVDWQRCQWTWPCVFIVNFEDVQYINLQKRDQDSWKSRIEHVSGIVNAALRLLAIVHYCWKVLHLKCLPGSWPCLWFVVFFCWTLNKQKQPFGDVLWNRCSLKFRAIHKKTPVLESLFNEFVGLHVCNFMKKRLQHRCFLLNIAKFLRTTYFYR